MRTRLWKPWKSRNRPPDKATEADPFGGRLLSYTGQMSSYDVGVYHPTYQNGKRLWMDPEVQEITDKLRFGDPTLGWEGDARFAIYMDGKTNRWEVQHIDDRGTRYVVCRSKPGAHLDERLIIEIRNKVYRMNKGVNEFDAVEAHNEKVWKELNDKFSVRKQQALAEAEFYLGGQKIKGV